MVNNLPAVRETWAWSLLDPGKIPWRREWQPTPVFLPGEFHGQRSLVSYRVTKSWTQLSDSLSFPLHNNSDVWLGIWLPRMKTTFLSLSFSTEYLLYFAILDFPGGTDSKVSAYNAGDLGAIPGSGRSPGEGDGNPLQYSCLENPMDGGAWWLQSMGLQRAGQDWATSLIAFIKYCIFYKLMFMAVLHQSGLSAPFAQQHLLTSRLSHFGSAHSISNFFVIIMFVMVICDHQSLMFLLSLFWDAMSTPKQPISLQASLFLETQCWT